MLSNLLRLAPITAVLSLIVYCAWSGDTPTALPTVDSNLPRLSQDLINPPLVKAEQRNPFGDLSSLGKREKDKIKVAEQLHPERTSKAVEKPIVATGLVLNGTSLGREKLAVINNRVYGEGERLREGTAKGGKSNWVVARILPTRVELRQGDVSVEITFTDRRAGSPGAGKQGRSRTAPSNSRK